MRRMMMLGKNVTDGIGTESTSESTELKHPGLLIVSLGQSVVKCPMTAISDLPEYECDM